MTKKKTGGRPQQILSKQEKELIAALYREGKTDKQVGDVLGMPQTTLQKILKYNGLSVTIKKIKTEEPDEKVKRSLFERACGYSHPAVKIFCQGAMVTREEYTEHYPPDTAAAIFWLCNRQPEKWKNVQKIDASGLIDSFAAIVRAIREKDNGS